MCQIVFPFRNNKRQITAFSGIWKRKTGTGWVGWFFLAENQPRNSTVFAAISDRKPVKTIFGDSERNLRFCLSSKITLFIGGKFSKMNIYGCRCSDFAFREINPKPEKSRFSFSEIWQARKFSLQIAVSDTVLRRAAGVLLLKFLYNYIYLIKGVFFGFPENVEKSKAKNLYIRSDLLCRLRRLKTGGKNLFFSQIQHKIFVIN